MRKLIRLFAVFLATVSFAWAQAAFQAGMTPQQLQTQVRAAQSQGANPADIAKAALTAGVSAEEITAAMIASGIAAEVVVRVMVLAGADPVVVVAAAVRAGAPADAMQAVADQATAQLLAQTRTTITSQTPGAGGSASPN